jgi:hypothetical protein
MNMKQNAGAERPDNNRPGAICSAIRNLNFAASQPKGKRKIMKLKYTMALALTALGAVALIATAQDNNDGPPPGGGGPDGPGAGGDPGHHHRHPPLPLVLALDTNHDGIIDAAEIANASAELLTLDTNHDGVLTTNEYMPPWPKNLPADAPRPPIPLIVKALDANGDGVIDAAEIANAPAALRTLDKNGDGVLTRDEYLGKRHGPPPRGGSEGNDDGPGGPPPGDAPDGPPPGGE